LYEEFLDSAIYAAGKEITAAGEGLGKRIHPLGEMQYPYVLIKGKELNLFERRSYLPVRFFIGIWSTF
jgi:outer membrane lipoprotein